MAAQMVGMWVETTVSAMAASLAIQKAEQTAVWRGNASAELRVASKDVPKAAHLEQPMAARMVDRWVVRKVASSVDQKDDQSVVLKVAH